MDSNRGIFPLLISLQIPSFICAIRIFLQYTQRTSPLRSFQNHLLMYLLIVSTWTITIDLVNTQAYCWTGIVTIHTNWFCSIWNLSFFSTSTLNRVLMAFMCIERHFLVFRPQLYQTRRSRFLFHYIPLIFIISSILIYFIITNLVISCAEVNYNYSLFMCGYSCTVLVDELGMIYAWLWVFTPTIVTLIGSILLPIRFIIQKRQLQRVDWFRSRKIILQTSVIAGVYTFGWLPYTIFLQLLVNNVISLQNPDMVRYFAVVPYMPSLFTPFIVFHTIGRAAPIGIIEKLKHRLFPQRQGLVQPMNNFVAQQKNVLTGDKRTTSKCIKKF